MSKNKLPQRHHKLACALPLLVTGLVSYPLEVQANAAQSFRNRVTNTPNLFVRKFPDNGAPTGRRRGGTSRRSGCPHLKTPITALVPGEENNNKSFLGLTVAEYPTFWVYVPDLPSNVRSGEFVLQDEQGNDAYRKSLTLSGKPGAISISLPSSSQYALKQDLKYHWFFRVYCSDPQTQPEYFFVDAWLQRVALTPDLRQQLNSKKSREYTVYAAHNLWYDAITNLAELRGTHSELSVFAEDWMSLFKAVGLGELAQAPIVQHYHLQN
ncbi:DUF928 domain-containing protein [Mastigocladopsis repens]|uniref:DUF928 domain-containing protein n=1 Tax=Mastigocladopsis repens TaxID=221287 RepID=UPI00036A83D6|nr:DUF928 domain-containing protein [Mastigocladopsis repens]